MARDLYMEISPISETQNEIGYYVHANHGRYCTDGDTPWAKFLGKKEKGIYVLKRKISRVVIKFEYEENMDPVFGLEKADNLLYKEAKIFADSQSPYSIISTRSHLVQRAIEIVSVND